MCLSPLLIKTTILKTRLAEMFQSVYMILLRLSCACAGYDKSPIETAPCASTQVRCAIIEIRYQCAKAALPTVGISTWAQPL